MKQPQVEQSPKGTTEKLENKPVAQHFNQPHHNASHLSACSGASLTWGQCNLAHSWIQMNQAVGHNAAKRNEPAYWCPLACHVLNTITFTLLPRSLISDSYISACLLTVYRYIPGTVSLSLTTLRSCLSLPLLLHCLFSYRINLVLHSHGAACTLSLAAYMPYHRISFHSIYLRCLYISWLQLHGDYHSPDEGLCWKVEEQSKIHSLSRTSVHAGGGREGPVFSPSKLVLFRLFTKWLGSVVCFSYPSTDRQIDGQTDEQTDGTCEGTN